MASMVQFDLVSPERRLASYPATEVQIPGAMGDLTAMEGHAPTITSLRPGLLKVVSSEGTKAYVVTGGFAEISATGVSVLAEQAVKAALADYYRRQGIDPEPIVGKLEEDCEHCESCGK